MTNPSSLIELSLHVRVNCGAAEEIREENNTPKTTRAEMKR
jgi:hypothetical protein